MAGKEVRLMMKCPSHSRSEVVGYCSVCGTFGCKECLTQYEGEFFCAKHYRPIAQRLEQEQRLEERRRQHPRQRLVVRFADGRRAYGVCFSMVLTDEGFHLDLTDASGVPLGKTEKINFKDLKAVFHVKSFDGKPATPVPYKAFTPEGPELVVVFRDGEIVRGFSPQRHNTRDPRFYLISKDPNDNNISILVERTAVEAVYTAEEYEEMLARKRETSRENALPENISHEEAMGDFHFEMREYETALQCYQQALSKFPRSPRLIKKTVLALYDTGVQYIKRREYDKALHHMEQALRLAPHNESVVKKVAQLKHVLKKQEQNV